jgi:protein-tyrosine-phosphatase
VSAPVPDPGTLSAGRLEYPIRVLFLCTGNSARSQIAEALLKHKGGERFVVASAGTQPAADVRPEAVAALREVGIDWSDAHPKSLDAIQEWSWDMVITLCDRALETCPRFPNRPVTAHWGIPDPSHIPDATRRLVAFHDTVALLAWRIDLMLALRPDLFEKLVLEERLQAIGAQSPPSLPTTNETCDAVRTDL